MSGRERSLPGLTGAPRAGSDRARVPSPLPLQKSILGSSRKRGALGHRVGCSSIPTCPVPKHLGKKQWEQYWRKFGAVSAGARATQETRTFSERFLRFPAFVFPTFSTWSYPERASRHSLHVDALSSWPATPASRHGSAGCWVLRGDGQGGGGVEGTRPSPGELAAGWPGCPESRTYERSQPLLRAGKQPVLSVDWREVGVTPLASSALPQPEGLGSLGKLSQLHVAGKEVALESGGPGFSSCVTLCKSFNFSERVSQLLKTAHYPTTLGGCRE